MRVTKQWVRDNFDGFNIGPNSDRGYFTVADIAKAVQARVRDYCKRTRFDLAQVCKWQIDQQGTAQFHEYLRVYVWLKERDGSVARIELYIYARKGEPLPGGAHYGARDGL